MDPMGIDSYPSVRGFSSVESNSKDHWKEASKKHPKSAHHLQHGPLPVISRAMTPLIEVVTPVAHLSGNLKGYNMI